MWSRPFVAPRAPRPWLCWPVATTSPTSRRRGEVDRLRETIEVLSDHDLLRDVRAGLEDLHAGRGVPAEVVAEELRRRSSQE